MPIGVSRDGAPAELVERAHASAMDEIKHARRCFALASVFGGVSWTAGPLPSLEETVEDVGPKENGLARLTRGCLLDGVLAEGLAAAVAFEGFRSATDPVIRETLEMIAAEESKHEALAWDILQWALERGGTKAVRSLRATLDELENRKTPTMPAIPGVSEEWLANQGLPTQARLCRLFDAQVTRIRKRAQALHGAPTAKAA